MAHINLLPWREELRKQRQKEFVTMAGLAVLFAAAIWGLVHMQMDNRINAQNQRNAYLEQQIKVLDGKIARIQELEKTRANLLARMNIIQQLQSSRPESVHLMDQLVRTLPDGVHLTSIKQAGAALTLVGQAQSNARVSAYMRNIDGSEWMANPRLDFIQTREVNQRRVAEFTLRAAQVRAQAATDGEAAQ
jgi:type IV pilus assembly protein PilN